MTDFLALLITGVVTGGIYAILSSGLVLTYVTTGIFNFAYGATAFTVAYVYYQLHSGLGWPTTVTAPLSLLVFAPLLGIVLDRAIYQNLAKASGVAKLVTTIGVLVALPNIFVLLADWAYGSLHWPLLTQSIVALPPGIGPYPPKVWGIAPGATINSDQLAVFVAAIFVSVVLGVLVKKTRLGLNVRAAVDRPGLASLRGINPSRLSTQTTVLGSVIAGLAGILIAPLFNLDPTEFTVIMFVAAAGAVLGRLRSIPLAMVGGLLAGVVQSLVSGYINIEPSLVPGLEAGVPFVLLFVGVLVLGRDRGRSAGVATEDVPVPDYLNDLPVWRRRLPWVIASVGLVAWIETTSPYYASLTSGGIALAIIFLSFVLITGTGGMVSLAQAAFVTLGALTAGLLVAHGVPFLPAALTGAAASCAMGLVVALPSLRLSGLWLALSTLVAGFMADEMLFQVPAIQGSGSGWPIARPVIGPFNFNNSASYGLLLLAIFGIVAVLVRNLTRSPTGRLMSAVRSSQVGAETAGASAVMPKLVLFGVSATIAGFGGTLLAANDFRIDPLDYPTTVGMVWVAVMAVFGTRRIASAMIAGLLYMLFPQLLLGVTNSTLLPTVLFGLGAISLARNPDGMMALYGGLLRKRRDRRRHRRTLGNRRPAVALSVSPLGPSWANCADDAGQMVPAIEFCGVSAGYEGVQVLYEVHLVVPKGELVLVLGPNGAGKSTLCAVAAGSHQPTSGRVRFEGEDVTELPSFDRAARGLLLAPEYRGVFPGLSVEDNIAVWVPDKAKREAALARFPVLRERRHQPAQLLSGGEQQMLSLAPLLEQTPTLLVVDEPTLGLSPLASKQVLTTLARMRSAGTTLVVAEERLREALTITDHLVALERGRVTWDGRATKFDEDLLRELYVGK